MVWKHTLQSRKCSGAVVNKEGHACDNLLEHERPMIIDFLEKGATVNSASYLPTPYFFNNSHI